MLLFLVIIFNNDNLTRLLIHSYIFCLHKEFHNILIVTAHTNVDQKNMPNFEKRFLFEILLQKIQTEKQVIS